MPDIGPFPGYFLDDKQYPSYARSVGVYNPKTDWPYSHLKIVCMLNPVQSNCDAHDTTANVQYVAIWSVGHIQHLCDRSPSLKHMAADFWEICCPLVPISQCACFHQKIVVFYTFMYRIFLNMFWILISYNYLNLIMKHLLFSKGVSKERPIR